MTVNRTRIALSLLALAAILLLVMPRTSKLVFEYKKGLPWKYETLIAPFDFPILKTEDQMVEERLESNFAIVPYYRFQDDVLAAGVRAVENIDFGPYAYMRADIVGSVRDILSKGVLSDAGLKVEKDSVDPDIIYIQRDKRVTTCPASEVYTLADAKSKLGRQISEIFTDVNTDSLLRASGVYDALAPDLAFDSQATELLHSESAKEISPTSGYVRAGQLIVSSGEIVTAEIAQMIDSYKKEYESNVGLSGSGFLHWTGNLVIVAMLISLLFLAMYSTDPAIFTRKNRYLYALLVFTIFTVASITVPRTEPGLLFMFPFVLGALMLEAFFDRRLVISIYAVSILPLLLFAEKPVPVFLVFLTGGVVTVSVFKAFSKGWKQFIAAIIAFAVMSFLYLGLWAADMADTGLAKVLPSLLVSSLLCVFVYPLVYLLERIFNLVSHFRLSELCDTSSPLLRALEQKAPGSFQHSLQVMNMADAVAGAIGANVPLVRAGALYHDIGKMQNPLCFVENESMLLGDEAQRYHSELSPLQSAQDIIRHISDGEELARRNRLPSVISDFIVTHHGTTRVAYFYDKYLRAGGDPSHAGEFCYPGRKPVTREQVILMLCDSVEAASRTLKDYSKESFSNFVEKIIDGKLEEGQLSEAEISVKDLDRVRQALKDYLAQMYHERIAYPKRKNK